MRDFLNCNTRMKEDFYPLWNRNCILLTDASTDGGTYCINPVNHLYWSPRGHVEQFYGLYESSRSGGCIGLGAKNKDIPKWVNRRIRHMQIKEERIWLYSKYKKMYAILDMGIL